MQIDDKLLGQLTDFLNTSEGANILSDLKKTLKQDSGDSGKASEISSLFSGFSKKNGQGESPFGNINMQKLIPLVSAISSAKTDDRATNLLYALKPLMSSERSEKIDRAVSVMRIMALLPILKEHGFSLDDLFSK